MTEETGESIRLSTVIVLSAGLISTLLVVFIMCNVVLTNFTDKQNRNITTLGYQVAYGLSAHPDGVSGPVIYKAVVESNGAVDHVYIDGNLLYTYTDGTYSNLMILTTKYSNKSYIVSCKESKVDKYMLDLYLTEVSK